MSVMDADPKKLEELRLERSLVIIKPDGVIRHLVGEILTRFERKGLKIMALKLVHPTPSQVEEHYEANEDWYLSTGQRTFDGYTDRGITPDMTPREIGLKTREKLMNYLGAGPVVVMVLQGAHVIETVRKLRGATSPLNAEVGTIGFDYTLESYAVADAGDWAIRNIIHGSDAPEAAEREIGIWFTAGEIVDDYITALDPIIYSSAWHKPKK